MILRVMFFLPEAFLLFAVSFYTIAAVSVETKYNTFFLDLKQKFTNIYWFYLNLIMVFYILIIGIRVFSFNDYCFVEFIYQLGVFDSYLLYLQLFMSFVILFLFLFLKSEPMRNTYTFLKNFELGIFLLSSLFFLNLLLLSDSLLIIFIAIEGYNICIIAILVLDSFRNTRSLEAAIKYFVFGAISSSVLLLGFSLLYWGLGSINLFHFRYYASFGNLDSYKYAYILLGALLALIAICIKLGLPPFHNWLVEVYDSVSYQVLFWLLNVVKVYFFVFFMNFFYIFASWSFSFFYIALLINTCTLIFGCFGALYQTKLKRLFGYSSILNFGFLLLPVALGIEYRQNLRIIFFYLFFYLLIMCGVLGIFIMLNNWSLSVTGVSWISIKKIEDLSSIPAHSKFLACALSLFFISLAGFPPFGLFYSKMYLIFSLGIQSFASWFLIIFSFCLSIIAIFYYLRLVELLWLPSGRFLFFEPSSPMKNTLISFVIFVICIFFFIFLKLKLDL